MKASVSLWSADQLALGAAIDALDAHVDGFHIDVMDGQVVPELLYGPDLVRAVAGRARRARVDVHLMLAGSDAWIDRFAAAGAGMLTVHRRWCRDVAATLRAIGELGVQPSVALELGEPVAAVEPLLGLVDRVLLMGTEIGVKGVELSPEALPRIRELRALAPDGVELFVDGGIRAHTIAGLARAGADGVTPGSLVFGRPDWLEGVRLIAEAG
jgi:ribulose-phosphate 3-epimerase